MFQHLRIQHKLSIAFVGFSIVPLMVIGGYAWYVGAQFLRESAMEELARVADATNRRLVELALSVDKDLSALRTAHPAIVGRDDTTEAEIQHHTEHWLDQGFLLMRSRPYYARINYLTEYPEDNVLNFQRNPYDRSEINTGFSQYSWMFYKLLVDDLPTGKSRMSPVEHLHRPSNTLIAAFTFAMPDRDENGELRGILTADIFADHVFSIIESGLIGREHYIAGLVDDDGNYLYHSLYKQNWNRLLVDKGSSTLKGDFAEGLTLSNIIGPAGFIITSDGDVVYHTPIDLQTSSLMGHYYFYLSQPGSIIFATLRKWGIVTAIIALVFGTIALILSYTATRQFVLPIHTLKIGADIIASGKFSHRLLIESGDEIEELADQFNEMANFIQERDNQLKEYSSNLEDLVEKRTAQLKREQQQVLQAEKLAALGEMAAVIAHEIRNSLTSAKMLLQVIGESDSLSPRQNKALGVVLDSISRINEITTGLLSFAKPEPLRKLPVDIKPLLHDTINLHNLHLEKQDIKVNIRIAQNLPRVYLDRELIREVATNLILNASYSIGDHGTIDIDVELIDRQAINGNEFFKGMSWGVTDRAALQDRLKESDYIKLSIHDDGGGIPDDVLPMIFEPFFTTKAKGTGLGLSMAKRVIEQHEGSIFARNHENGGAVFTILLPVGGSLES